VRILVFPRDDGNPYQRLLYGEMRRLGAREHYVGRLTRSHTLNLLLLPLEMAAWRVRGARIVHVHWVHKFAVTGSDRLPVLRRVSQLWFAVWLRTVSVLRLRLVWTAHNAMPHGPVFADDVAARRALVRACSLVVAHTAAGLAELAPFGVAGRRTAVIPHGPFGPAAAPVRTPGDGARPRNLLFLGRIEAYKGIEDLLTAFAALPVGVPARLTIAGECPDDRLRSALLRSADGRDCGVTMQLGWVADAELDRLFSEADAVVLPFRQATTSGSAALALGHGRPAVVPELTAFADLPDAAVIRYDGTVAGLTAALARVAGADAAALAEMSAAALRYARRVTWAEIAERTAAEMDAVVGAGARASSDGSVLAVRRPPGIPS
jgi:glycosyltransferase involved in cell wall biosynthesis